MEKLSLHIEYLLRNHECVILPGFGAFISVYVAPRFDEAKGVITPPKREIRFNQFLTNDDGLLANSFARKLQISHSEGSRIVARYVSMVNDSLFKDDEVSFGRIGSIRKESEGNLTFSPCIYPDRLAAEIGFLPVPFSSPSPLEISEVRTSKLDFKRNYYIPVNKRVAKLAVSILICIMFLLAFFKPTVETFIHEVRASVFPIEKFIQVDVYDASKIKNINNEKN